MRTKRKPASRGVRILDRTGRPNPYGVQWREKIVCPRTKTLKSIPKTLFFPTAEARDAKAAQLREDRRNRMVMPSMSREDVAEWQAFKNAIGATPWHHVVAGWRAWMIKNGQADCTVTVDQAVKRSLAEAAKLVAKEKMSPDTRRQRKHKLCLFAEQFGHLTLNQVSAPEVEAWIEDFDEVQSDGTFNNYRKHIRALFTPYVKVERIIDRNPIDAVKKRDDDSGEVGINTPEEVARLFLHAMRTPRFTVAIGRLALEAFVGLRFSSGCRLEKKDINFADRGILLPKKKLKTRKRHYIDGVPDQVWDWLAITPEACWQLPPRLYMLLKSELFVAAGVPHPFNCLRHNFCTYDIAAHRDAGRTAYFLCHSDQELVWSTYKGNATEAQGVWYQAITPRTVEALLEGRASPLRCIRKADAGRFRW
ncbi:hypothetical protein OpiT1DRAFT_01255 [Opitutaceae bacterium TAV1]|nr:hypothetical protein OpiT1DRAFT_01255 [Opitutaceae bacterium TAV1]